MVNEIKSALQDLALPEKAAFSRGFSKPEKANMLKATNLLVLQFQTSEKLLKNIGKEFPYRKLLSFYLQKSMNTATALC